MPCDCPNTVASNVLGHLWVRCRAEGCPSIWYRPRHQPAEQGLADADSVASWPGVWRPVAVALAGAASAGRKPGAWRGKMTMSADFDHLTPEIDAAFRGEAT